METKGYPQAQIYTGGVTPPLQYGRMLRCIRRERHNLLNRSRVGEWHIFIIMADLYPLDIGSNSGEDYLCGGILGDYHQLIIAECDKLQIGIALGVILFIAVDALDSPLFQLGVAGGDLFENIGDVITYFNIAENACACCFFTTLM